MSDVQCYFLSLKTMFNVQFMSNIFDLMFNTVPPRPISTLVLKKCAYIAAYILVLVSWECFKGMNGTLKMTILQTFKSASWCNSFKYRIMQRNNDSKKMRCGSKTEKVLLSRMKLKWSWKELSIWNRKYLLKQMIKQFHPLQFWSKIMLMLLWVVLS